MGDSLDELFDKGMPSGKKSLKFLKTAYDCGAQTLVNRSLTDKLLQNSGLKFHIGTDDPTMRRIASWLLTNHKESIDSLIPLLWKRRGREDIKLIGLLIANIEGDAWGKFLGIPSADYLKSYNKSTIQKQNAMLIASLGMREDLIELVESTPKGGDLFERIRSRALNQ